MVELSFQFLHAFNKLGYYKTSNINVAHTNPRTIFKGLLLVCYECADSPREKDFSEDELKTLEQEQWNKMKDEFLSYNSKQRDEFFSWMRSKPEMGYFVYQFHHESFDFFTKHGFNFNDLSTPQEFIFSSIIQAFNIRGQNNTIGIYNAADQFLHTLNSLDEDEIEYLKKYSALNLNKLKEAVSYAYIIEAVPQLKTESITDFFQNTVDNKLNKMFKSNPIALLDYLNQATQNPKYSSSDYLIAFNYELQNGYFMKLISTSLLQFTEECKTASLLLANNYEYTIQFANQLAINEGLKQSLEHQDQKRLDFYLSQNANIIEVYNQINFDELDKHYHNSDEKYLKVKEYFIQRYEKTKLEKGIHDSNSAKKIKI